MYNAHWFNEKQRARYLRIIPRLYFLFGDDKPCMRLQVFGCDGGKHQKIFSQLQCMHKILIDMAV